MTDRLNSNARAAELGHPLSARDVYAGYGRQTVLSGISLDIVAGTLTALVGPNGCGKSTMLATIARLMKPSAGNVLLEGHDIHVLPTRSVARKLGLLPQSPVVPEGLTVYDLVSRGRHPHQGFLKQWTDNDEKAVRQALEVTDLSDLLHRPVDSLSGGQRQRCWIAMALAQQTPVILLDEPTTYLDLHYQVEVMELLRHLARDHDRTIIVVLHDLNFAVQYADCVVFLKNGSVRHIAEDPGTCTAELIEDVFSVQVIRLTHPETDKPVFVPAHGTGPIT